LTCNFFTTALYFAGQKELPFVGQKSFDFYGGAGTGSLVKINQNGRTRLEIIGTQSSSVDYEREFINSIKLKDEITYFFKNGKVYLLDSKGQVEKDCKGDGTECVADLYDVEPLPPRQTSASNANASESDLISNFDPDSKTLRSKPWWPYRRSLVHSNDLSCDMYALAPFSAAKQAGTTVEDLPKNADLQLERGISKNQPVASIQRF